MPIVRGEEVDASQLLLGKQMKSYGPAEIQYCDYGMDMQKLDMCFGPVRSPFGLGAFKDNVERMNLVVDMMNSPVVARKLNEIDDKFAAHTLHKNSMLASACDGTFRVHCPLVRVKEGSQELRKFRAAFFRKHRVAGEVVLDPLNDAYSVEEIRDICAGNKMYYVIARLVGCVRSSMRVGARWEAMQIVIDETADMPEQVEFKPAGLDMFM